jgi:hypothetical protein
MRVLLTGSSGWLGRRLAPRLRQAGHEPLGLDVAAGPHTDVVGSVADAALVGSLFSRHGLEAVIHAGALHKPDIARERIGRVYDPSLAERVLGFRCRTDFAAVLAALRQGEPPPFEHDPGYVAPRIAAEFTASPDRA